MMLIKELRSPEKLTTDKGQWTTDKGHAFYLCFSI
jgi:hypothetical protein